MVPLLVCGGLLVVADQTSKWFITRLLADTSSSSLGSLARIRLVANRQLALGFAQNPFSLLFLWSIASLAVILLVQYGPLFHNQTAQAALGAAWGGATSNLFDYLRRGAIVDFIDLGFWPVFNLADVAICLGALVALLNAH